MAPTPLTAHKCRSSLLIKSKRHFPHSDLVEQTDKSAVKTNSYRQFTRMLLSVDLGEEGPLMDTLLPRLELEGVSGGRRHR